MTGGADDQSSYAFSLIPAGHWDLPGRVAVVSQAHKLTGSTQGHTLALILMQIGPLLTYYFLR